MCEKSYKYQKKQEIPKNSKKNSVHMACCQSCLVEKGSFEEQQGCHERSLRALETSRGALHVSFDEYFLLFCMICCNLDSFVAACWYFKLFVAICCHLLLFISPISCYLYICPYLLAFVSIQVEAWLKSYPHSVLLLCGHVDLSRCRWQKHTLHCHS